MFRAQRVCGIFNADVWLAGVHVATGRAGDSWSTGGFVPRQNRSLDEDI